MTKYTKRQYVKDVAANEAAIVAVKAEIAAYFARLEAGEKIADLEGGWNAAYDRETDLENERHDIEMRYVKRNWTWQDHAFNDLVALNID